MGKERGCHYRLRLHVKSIDLKSPAATQTWQAKNNAIVCLVLHTIDPAYNLMFVPFFVWHRLNLFDLWLYIHSCVFSAIWHARQDNLYRCSFLNDEDPTEFLITMFVTIDAPVEWCRTNAKIIIPLPYWAKDSKRQSSSNVSWSDKNRLLFPFAHLLTTQFANSRSFPPATGSVGPCHCEVLEISRTRNCTFVPLLNDIVQQTLLFDVLK